MAPQARAAERTGFIDRYSVLFITLAAAMWAADAFFRPVLVHHWKLSPSQIVLVEDLLISLCFLPVVGRVARELRRASWRSWLALAVIAVGPQAFATVLFTRSLAFATTLGAQSEVYLLYLLQPVFGVILASVLLRERRRPAFWPLAAVALGGAVLIVVAQLPAAPQGALLAALLVVGAVILWAAGTVLGRYALADVSFSSTSAMRFWMALPVLLVLELTDRGIPGLGQYSLGQLPSFLGIALIPGVIAMVLYYRALSSTRASVSSFAELGYPAALFLVYSLPSPVGFGLHLQPMEVAGAALLVIAVTVLNFLMRRDVVTGPQPRELRLASEAPKA